jgi:hypothetical protein
VSGGHTLKAGDYVRLPMETGHAAGHHRWRVRVLETSGDGRFAKVESPMRGNKSKWVSVRDLIPIRPEPEAPRVEDFKRRRNMGGAAIQNGGRP